MKAQRPFRINKDFRPGGRQGPPGPRQRPKEGRGKPRFPRTRHSAAWA